MKLIRRMAFIRWEAVVVMYIPKFATILWSDCLLSFLSTSLDPISQSTTPGSRPVRVLILDSLDSNFTGFIDDDQVLGQTAVRAHVVLWCRCTDAQTR